MKNSAVQSAVTQNINMLNKLQVDCPDGKCRLQDFVYY